MMGIPWIFPDLPFLFTGSYFMELLSKTGLEDHYENKLMLSTVLEINANTTSDEPLTTMQSLPGAFLQKLMMANLNARSVICKSSDAGVSFMGTDRFENLKSDSANSNVINPLDLITALFLCSDGFLQEEMVQKMSMCQFAVPLLLPNCDTKQSTLMLWALRDIVKKFRLSSQTSTKAFVEERIVLSDIPMVSFVRLGEIRVPKSQILNKLLSNPQQYHDTFVHHDMECGDITHRISDGLVEISWYFPCGNRNIDMFTKPVAVANLRGDIRSFEKQFTFLCQTSAAVYIFTDDFEADINLLKSKNTTAELFLVSSVGDIIEKSPDRLTVENMTDVARHIGIVVDEDRDECQSARKITDEITRNITDTVTFKDKQLPLQGQVWKEISQLEKERCRLRKAGGQDIEHYKSSLKKKEEELREKQHTFNALSTMVGNGPSRRTFIPG
uniref:Up-regulator of cell proliferation-like domain-containing protein n=1 Tax=Hucho hucho TaxID=62062 RepID=A0A4W5LB46_9TELE